MVVKRATIKYDPRVTDVDSRRCRTSTLVISVQLRAVIRRRRHNRSDGYKNAFLQPCISDNTSENVVHGTTLVDFDN